MVTDSVKSGCTLLRVTGPPWYLSEIFLMHLSRITSKTWSYQCCTRRTSPSHQNLAFSSFPKPGGGHTFSPLQV